jgi:hypothetical protein
MSMKKGHHNSLCGNRALRVDKRSAKSKARGLKLLPYAIRENLPILGSRQHMGGKAKALAKCSTGDGSFAWYITEGSARRDTDGNAVDYLLYGLVEDQCRKLDYFWLSDFERVHGQRACPWSEIRTGGRRRSRRLPRRCSRPKRKKWSTEIWIDTAKTRSVRMRL